MALSLIIDIPKHLHHRTSGEGSFQHGHFFECRGIKKWKPPLRHRVRELRQPDAAKLRGQTLTAEIHLFHNHILTCPKSSGFAALSTPQKQGDGRVQAGVCSGSSAPTRQSTVPRDASRWVSMRVALFLSRRCRTLWSLQSLITLSKLWRLEVGLD